MTFTLMQSEYGFYVKRKKPQQVKTFKKKKNATYNAIWYLFHELPAKLWKSIYERDI